MENKINIARFKEGSRTAEVKGIWQWDYGQILRIQGLNLPTAVEIHFSLDEQGGEALRRIGMTNDGVTDVVIPDSMIENESAYDDSYYFFAYIYLSDEESGNTEYKIRAKVTTRSKPEGYNSGDSTFAAILKTVNEIAVEKIARPLMAKVGQVLSVKATDEEGKPTEFEATDPGGGVSDEKIAEVVGTYMEAHPINETDPTVSDWAKQPEKPTYTAEEVGALPAGTMIPKSASDVGADAEGTAESKVSAHNTSDMAHNDIRLLIEGLTTRLNALADSDDTTLDQMSEVVAYIKSNKSLIDAIATSKINVSDIIDNLTTNVSNKPLSAAQGVKLKALIDEITTVELDESLTDNTKAAPAGMVGELKGDIIHYAKVENGILYLYNDIEMTKEILHVTIPASSGGSSSDDNDNWVLISNSDETMGSVSMLGVTTDNQGESFRLKKAVLFVWVTTGESYNYVNFGFEKYSWITSISGKPAGYMYRILMEKDVDGEWAVRTSRATFDGTTFLPTTNFSSEVIGKRKRYLSDFIESVFFETGPNSSYAKYALYGVRG